MSEPRKFRTRPDFPCCCKNLFCRPRCNIAAVEAGMMGTVVGQISSNRTWSFAYNSRFPIHRRTMKEGATGTGLDLLLLCSEGDSHNRCRVPPSGGYLELRRELTQDHKIESMSRSVANHRFTCLMTGPPRGSPLLSIIYCNNEEMHPVSPFRPLNQKSVIVIWSVNAKH